MTITQIYRTVLLPAANVALLYSNKFVNDWLKETPQKQFLGASDIVKIHCYYYIWRVLDMNIFAFKLITYKLTWLWNNDSLHTAKR